MFRDKAGDYYALSTAVVVVLLSVMSGLADTATSQTTLDVALILRYRSEAEIAQLPTPTFLLLSPFRPPEQRTESRCTDLGAFKDWERKRAPWKTRLALHYYNESKRFISISDYPTDPRPEQFQLSSVEDIRYVRMLIESQSADRSGTPKGSVSRDMQQMADSLGVALQNRLLPRFPATSATAGTALSNAFWQTRSNIAAGTTLVRSITPLITGDGRRFVRTLTVIQIRGSYLPLEVCYYPTPSVARHVEHSEGLTVPPRGLDFVPSIVSVPLYVYLLDGGGSRTDVDRNINAAVAIWEKAGVILTPKLEVVDRDRTIALLGKNEGISYYFSCEQRFANEKEYEARVRLSKLRPDSRSLAVFFGDAKATQSEPELLQAYIGADPNRDAPGLTVAHEIGHLLFGSGHVGGETRGPCVDPSYHTVEKHPVTFTSALMKSPQSSSGIDYQDAIAARKQLLTLADARWW